MCLGLLTPETELIITQYPSPRAAVDRGFIERCTELESFWLVLHLDGPRVDWPAQCLRSVCAHSPSVLIAALTHLSLQGGPSPSWQLYTNSAHEGSSLFPHWQTCCCHVDLSIITSGIVIFSCPAKGSSLVTRTAPCCSCL